MRAVHLLHCFGSWRKLGRWKHTLATETAVASGIVSSALPHLLKTTPSHYVVCNGEQFVLEKEIQDQATLLRREFAKNPHGVIARFKKNIHSNCQILLQCYRVLSGRKKFEEFLCGVQRAGRFWYAIMVADDALAALSRKTRGINRAFLS